MKKTSLFIQPLFKTLSALTIFTVVGVITILAARELKLTGIMGMQTAIAQDTTSRNISEIIYQKIPDLPRENKYISQESKKVAINNTLVSRIISYHNYVKRRPPNYRLDWKLTLADYLGVNEMIDEKSYPGSDTLRKNPLESDRAAVKKLSLHQRNALVQALVDIFSSN